MGHDIVEVLGQTVWFLLRNLYSFSYSEGGVPSEVLRAFSSAPTYTHYIPTKKEEKEELWNIVVEAAKKDYVICCGTQK